MIVAIKQMTAAIELNTILSLMVAITIATTATIKTKRLVFSIISPFFIINDCLAIKLNLTKIKSIAKVEK